MTGSQSEPVRARITTVLAVLTAFAVAIVFAAHAWDGLVRLEFGDETEKYVAASMLRHGGRLYGDVFANHGPLPYALAWLATFVTGTLDFTRTRLIIVALALAATASIAFSPALPCRGVGRLWAASLFLAPVSAFWFVHPLNMLTYHALGGDLVAVVLAQLTIPALLGREPPPASAMLAGAASMLAITAAYFFAAACALFIGAALMGTARQGGWPAARRLGLRLLAGGAAAAVPMAAWITLKADWVGYYVYHFYFNQFVYAKMTRYAWSDMLRALDLSFGPAERAHAFAMLAGLIGLIGLSWSARRLSWWTPAAIGAVALGLLLLNPKGLSAFPDTAQMIACLGLFALVAGRTLALTGHVRHGLAVIAALAMIVGVQQVARTALVSPHGILPSAAPIVRLRPDPNEAISQTIDRLVPPGATFLALPFMPATYLFAARQPASGAFYYLPFQAGYDSAPILGRTFDLCGDLRRVRPSVIMLLDIVFPRDGSITQYKPCLADVLTQSYVRYEPMPFLYTIVPAPAANSSSTSTTRTRTLE